MTVQHSSLSYHKTANSKLATFALGVRDGQFNNPKVFIIPAVKQPDFEDHIANYSDAYAAYKKGGSSQKGLFLTSKSTLMGDLDLFAVSTDGYAAGKEAIILLGGFVPTLATDSTGTIPLAPETKITRGASTGVLLAEATKVAGATSYGCMVSLKPLSPLTLIDKAGQLTIGASDFISKLDLTKGRKKQFVGLTAGTTYYIYFYASNAAGVSQLSKIESMMCA